MDGITDKIEENGALALAWIGTSIGAVDMGSVTTGLLQTAPSVQLLGAGAADPLMWGYLLAGAASIAPDILDVAGVDTGY
jgi:hypothetical protein